MKKIPDQKLAAFSTGLMGSRGLSKREMEELKKKEEEEAAAHVFKEFVETFQEVPSTTSKVWVKAGTYDAGARKEDTSERGKLYKPTSRLDEKRVMSEADIVRSLAARADLPGRPGQKAKQSSKKKSNLELFKEELRQMQEERSERHKYKNVLKEKGVVGSEPIIDTIPDIGSYDTGDPNTTNLYLGNLNPKITEQQLMEIFGRYGPLASIKIMWPRSDEEKARGRNCGFVAFMSRKDGERALRCINGKEILNYEMKLGWGKAVVIPPVPIYIPPALQQPSQPPPPSGLPFNAQPPKHKANKIPRVRPGDYYPSDPEDKIEYEKILAQSIVKVVVPTERNILMLIHRMVEFVIREGPMFEAIIMNKEMNNPFFRFLFENQSPAHVYYRWKLFSMLQGDSPKQWQLEDFRMFVGGSVWRPPVMNLYTAGMPDDLLAEDEAKDNLRGTLSNNQRDRLEELIRGLTPSRQSVGEVMAWCLEHAEAANEISQCILEALSGEQTAPHKRIARLYLISDILHNAGAKLTNASAYRNAFQTRLVEMMRQCNLAWSMMPSRLQQEGFRARVTRILQAWADWAVYPTDFLLRINDVFLGQEKEPAILGSHLPPESGSRPASPANSTASSGSWEGGGAGGPLDGAALRRLAASRQVEGDIDGVPMDEDIDGVPLEAESSEPLTPVTGAFVPSRWESVEPAPAPPSDTWPTPPPPPDPPAKEHDSEEASLSRETLREIEVRVVKYTDELEGGLRAQRPGLTHAQQIQHYRRKLIKKAAREAKEALAEVRESPDPRRRTPDVDDTYSNPWSSWKEEYREDDIHTTTSYNSANSGYIGCAETYEKMKLEPTEIGGLIGYPKGVNPIEVALTKSSTSWFNEELNIKPKPVEEESESLDDISSGESSMTDFNETVPIKKETLINSSTSWFNEELNIKSKLVEEESALDDISSGDSSMTDFNETVPIKKERETETFTSTSWFNEELNMKSEPIEEESVSLDDISTGDSSMADFNETVPIKKERETETFTSTSWFNEELNIKSEQVEEESEALDDISTGDSSMTDFNETDPIKKEGKKETFINNFNYEKDTKKIKSKKTRPRLKRLVKTKSPHEIDLKEVVKRMRESLRKKTKQAALGECLDHIKEVKTTNKLSKKRRNEVKGKMFAEVGTTRVTDILNETIEPSTSNQSAGKNKKINLFVAKLDRFDSMSPFKTKKQRFKDPRHTFEDLTTDASFIENIGEMEQENVVEDIYQSVSLDDTQMEECVISTETYKAGTSKRSESKKLKSAMRPGKRDRVAAQLAQLDNISSVEIKKERPDIPATQNCQIKETNLPLMEEVVKAKKKNKRQRLRAREQRELADTALSNMSTPLLPFIKMEDCTEATIPPTAYPTIINLPKKLKAVRRRKMQRKRKREQRELEKAVSKVSIPVLPGNTEGDGAITTTSFSIQLDKKQQENANYGEKDQPVTSLDRFENCSSVETKKQVLEISREACQTVNTGLPTSDKAKTKRQLRRERTKQRKLAEAALKNVSIPLSPENTN